jgi:hypothetical protein
MTAGAGVYTLVWFPETLITWIVRCSILSKGTAEEQDEEEMGN